MVRKPARPQLSDAQLRVLVAELRSAWRDALGDTGAVQQEHPQLTTRHSHEHSDYQDGRHTHVHEHAGDADHDHDHLSLQEEGAAVYGKHIRYERGQVAEMSVCNRARQAVDQERQVDEAFQRAYETISRTRGRPR